MSCRNRRRDNILRYDLDWEEHPSETTVVEAVSFFTAHTQPFQVFYHALRIYVGRGDEFSPIYGQFLSYFFHYGGKPSWLRTGRHNYAAWQASELMYAEGYRARVGVVQRLGCRCSEIRIVAPSDVYYVLPESASCA